MNNSEIILGTEMYQTSAALKRNYVNNGAGAYLANDILEASPEKLLLKVYDFAISNSKLGDLEKTNKALNILIGALRYDSEEAQEISLGLRRLYEYCQEEMRNKNFDSVHQILTELRDAWLKIL